MGFIGKETDIKHIVIYFQLFILMILIAIFGFFIGEWSDIKDDGIAGKNNFLANKSAHFKAGVTVGVVVLIAIVLYSISSGNINYIIAIGVQLLCFVLYSVPPFRLKKNRYASLVLDSLYSGTLMYVFVLMVAGESGYILISVFVWACLKGQRNYILHTLNDAKNDQKIGIKSLANTNSNILKIEKFVLFPLEIIAMLFSLYMIPQPYNFILIGIYTIVVLYSFYHRSNSELMDKYGYLSHINLFHEMALPLIVLVMLTTTFFYWIIPLGVLLLLFSQYKEWAMALIRKLQNL